MKDPLGTRENTEGSVGKFGGHPSAGGGGKPLRPLLRSVPENLSHYGEWVEWWGVLYVRQSSKNDGLRWSKHAEL